MCISCGDFVDMCTKCVIDPTNPYNHYAKFYLDDTLCEHLQAEHGVTTARELDRIRHPWWYENEGRDTAGGAQ